MSNPHNLDWANIGFQYRDTNGYAKFTWTPENGWDSGSFETDPMMKIHICATGLHYGQQVLHIAYAFIEADEEKRESLYMYTMYLVL